MEETIIFHVDVNNAYLSWEAVNRLTLDEKSTDLRLIPSVIGGDMKSRHGVVLAKSTPAKKYNIITGEPIQKALQKCPNLTLVPPNHDLYEESSRSLFDLLYEFSPNVEPYSIDEAFLDMTKSISSKSRAKEVARKMKEGIKTELGFTVNIGVSTNKLLAKMASDLKKPDMVHTLFPREVPDKMWPLPIEELFQVGKSTSRILRNLGIKTIGDLAHTQKGILKSHLGNKWGEIIYNNAWGINKDPVQVELAKNKGYGNSITLAEDITDFDEACLVFLSISERVGGRLRENKLKAYCIAIEVKDSKFIRQTKQTTLLTPTNTTNIIYETSCKLLKEIWDGRPLRLLGIRGTKLTTDQYKQLSLFDTMKNTKLEKLDKTLDAIRDKFGEDAVHRASLTNTQKEVKE